MYRSIAHFPNRVEQQAILFVHQDIRWGIQDCPVYIRTIREEDASAFSFLSSNSEHEPFPLSLDNARHFIREHRREHTPFTAKAEGPDGGPTFHSMAICFKPIGDLVIGFCGLTDISQVRSASRDGPYIRIGHLFFNMTAYHSRMTSIRNAAMRCLLTCAFSEASKSGFGLDKVIISPHKEERLYISIALDHLLLSQDSMDPSDRDRYYWEIDSIKWVPDNGWRFYWMPPIYRWSYPQGSGTYQLLGLIMNR